MAIISSTSSYGRITGSTILDLLVQDPGPAWRRMEPRWRLIEDITAGTMRMQEVGELYLPREPGELPFIDQDTGITIDPFQIRLANSMLTPFVGQMESMLAGMITRKPVRLEDTPQVIEEHLMDVDQAENDLNVFTHQFIRTAIRYGHAGILVDFPRNEDGTEGDRPYWVIYSPRDILDARADIINGSRRLSMLRLYECIEVPYGDWGSEVVEQVRVLEPGKFRLYRKQASTGSDFKLVEGEAGSGTTTTKEIPFAVAYANRTAWMESTPPLEEVAWLNLQHYRLRSDQTNLLHIAAVPKQFLYGFPAEVDKILAGPNFGIAAPQDARAEFCEPNGISYQARHLEITQVEEKIATLGMMTVMGQDLTNKSGKAKEIERSQGDAALMSVAMQAQDAIDTCIGFHAAYLGLATNAHCEVNRDFLSQRLGSDEVAQVIAMYNSPNPMITQETALEMLQGGQWISEELDIAKEIEAVSQLRQYKLKKQEDQLAAAMDAMPAPPPEDDAEDPEDDAEDAESGQ
jgi:hypothetical protein